VNGEPTQTHYIVKQGGGEYCKFCGKARVTIAKENDLP
jgi:hypothetical protein